MTLVKFLRLLMASSFLSALIAEAYAGYTPQEEVKRQAADRLVAQVARDVDQYQRLRRERPKRPFHLGHGELH